MIVLNFPLSNVLTVWALSPQIGLRAQMERRMCEHFTVIKCNLSMNGCNIKFTMNCIVKFFTNLSLFTFYQTVSYGEILLNVHNYNWKMIFPE